MNFSLKQVVRALMAVSLLALGTAMPAAAAIDPTGADLVLSMTSSASQVNSGGSITFSLTIRNTTTQQQVCEWDTNYLDKPIRVCYYETYGAPVSGVAVQDQLPAGSVFQSYTADSGFVCSASGTAVNCWNGSLAMSGTAHVNITAAAPVLAANSPNQTFTNSATVNPSQVINERSYGNNSASVSFTDIAPVALPDLVVTGFSGPSSVPQGGQATYTVNIANVGQGTANQVSVVIDGGNNGWNIVSSSGSTGFSPCYTSPERFSLRAWCPGFGYGPSLAPGQTATMTIVVSIPTGYTYNYQMSATVDPYNGVAESNEGNNAAYLWTYVY